MACLQSVYGSLGTLSAEVWVVDNASSDNSVSSVRKGYPQVSLIENDENVGYARANNQALCRAQGTICILLNPDTVVKKGAFQSLLDAFGGDKDTGVVGPLLLNEDNSIQPSFGSFASVWTEFFFQTFLYKIIPSPYPLGRRVHPWQRKSYQKAHNVDWVSGACLAVKRSVIEKAGMLDEDTFMYGEDMEWCWRIKNAGYSVLFWPKTEIIHYQRQSSRKDYSQWIVNYTSGTLRFVDQHQTRFSQVLISLLICCGSVLRIGLWCLFGLIKPSRQSEVRQRILGYARAIQLGWCYLLDGSALRSGMKT